MLRLNEADGPPVGPQHGIHDAEPHSGSTAFSTGGEKRLEYAVTVLIGNALSIISNYHLHTVVVPVCGDNERRRAMPGSVVRQVTENDGGILL